MAQNILKAKKRRVAPKKAATKAERKIVLVGTYREGQLAWIGKHLLYNYPVREGDKFDATALGKVSELWLYAGTKGKRHCYEAKFVRQMTREEWLKQNPTYAKLGRGRSPSAPQGRGTRPACPPHKAYYVFEVKPLEYGTRFDAPEVITRVRDFGGRSSKIKKAIEQYAKDGKFAPLAAYLPTELSQVPNSQLRVCEPLMQLDFINTIFPRQSVRQVNTSGTQQSRNVISLFSGAMGLDNGIEQAGLDIRLCVEFQHAMAETIRANRPDIPLIEDDVRNYSGADLLCKAGLKDGEEVFLVCGGPPCQAFSTAGKRLGFDDDRGNVFLKYLDLIGEIRPRYFLLENVRGLLSAAYAPFADAHEWPQQQKGTALLYAMEKINGMGYSATFTLYDAANYGVPQHRERVIILGSRDGYRIPLIPPTHSENAKRGLRKWKTFKSVVVGLKKCTAAKIPDKRLKYFHMIGPGQYWKDLPIEMQQEAMGKSYALPGGKTGFYRRLAWDEPSPTLVTCPTMPATDLMHPVEDRALSIEEYARIQMFPDSWVFKGSIADIYKQIGNAVPVGMGYAAARHLLWFDSLSDEQKIQAQLVDPTAVYSRYRNTDFEYFERLLEHVRMCG